MIRCGCQWMDIVTGNLGWIEAICGPMFSGKSEELMRRLRRSIIARKRVQVFKPAIDNRYSSDEIVSHNDLRMKSQAVQNASEILPNLDCSHGSGRDRRIQFPGSQIGGYRNAPGR